MEKRDFHPYEQLQAEEDDYIDMDMGSAIFISYSPRDDFEFHHISPPSNQTQVLGGEPLTSPADELFYKGNLLPLHLPPRLQMVQKLLQDKHPSPATNTPPFESCNPSPANSCYVSCELSPEDKSQKNRSWSKKLKASRSYLKSLFSKSGCSEDVPKAKETMVCLVTNSGRKKKKKKKRRSPFGGERCGHRRSFSGGMDKGASGSSSSSSNSSSRSSLSLEEGLKRSGSVNSEVERGIQGAISHCKRSQQVRKSVIDAGFCSLDALRIAAECETLEEPGVWG